MTDQPWTVPANECRACGDTKRDGACPTCSAASAWADTFTTRELNDSFGMWPLSHGRYGSYEAYESDPGCDGDPHDGGRCGDASHFTQAELAAAREYPALFTPASAPDDTGLPF